MDMSLFLCQFRGGQWIELRCEAKQHESTAARHGLNGWSCIFPCSPVGGSSEQKAQTEGCHSVIIIYDPFLL